MKNLHLQEALRHYAGERGRIDAYEAIIKEEVLANPYQERISAEAWRENFDYYYQFHRRDKN